MILEIALVSKPLVTDLTLYYQTTLRSPVPRLILDNIRRLENKILQFKIDLSDLQIIFLNKY